jgi:hypothetical protein
MADMGLPAFLLSVSLPHLSHALRALPEDLRGAEAITIRAAVTLAGM